jgi:hypothetical protein
VIGVPSAHVAPLTSVNVAESGVVVHDFARYGLILPSGVW